MQCLSCKREINSRNVPCPYCGARQDIETLTTEELKEEPKQEINHQNLMTSPLKEEQTPVENWFQEKNRKEQEQIYLKEYIGENYESFEQGGLSFCCFFFGIVYVLYRKQYLFMIIQFLLYFILLLVVTFNYNAISTSTENIIGVLIIYLAIHSAPVLFFKKFYYTDSLRKVRKILSENKEKSDMEIRNLCREKGGTSLVGPILIIILSVFVLPTISSFIKANRTTKVSLNGLIFESNSYLELPENINTSSYSVLKQGECSFQIRTETTNNANWMNSLKKDIAGHYTLKTINNNEWINFQDGYKDYYVSQNGRNVYMLEYEIINNNKECEKAKGIIIDSLNFE